MIEVGVPLAGRPDVPSHGRTLLSSTDPVATRLRKAAIALMAGANADLTDLYWSRFAPRDLGLAGSSPATTEQAVWASIGIWATLRVTSDVPVGLVEAERRFFQSDDPGLWAGIHESMIEIADDAILCIPRDLLRDLLPYVLDRRMPGTRRTVLRDPRQQSDRSERHTDGVFYTPGDVADHMVDWVLDDDQAPRLPILDPSCGTGVFLASAARRILECDPSDDPLDRLYGIDLDPIAVDATCFVLTTTLAAVQRRELWQVWHRARMNLAVRDTISLMASWDSFGGSDFAAVTKSRRELKARITSESTLVDSSEREAATFGEPLGQLFPEVSGSWHVVGNPPYAPLGPRADLRRLADTCESFAQVHATPRTNAYIPFTELMWRVSGGVGRSALVVPLSISFGRSRVHRSLRRAIVRARGDWRFRFFDRTPDSLFGDDVKQRTAIAYRAPSTTYRLSTTGLVRWASKRRSQLFADTPHGVDITGVDIEPLIPKLHEPWEADLYAAVQHRRRSRQENAAHTSDASTSWCVYIGSTAYNGLTLYLSERGMEPDWVSSTPRRVSSWPESTWTYAVLSSGLAYWLWRVEGDGFHVPNSWIEDVPFHWTDSNVDRRLSSLGEKLWAEAALKPTIAVNRGRRTVSFKAANDAVRREIDVNLLESLGLDQSTADSLGLYWQGVVAAGRNALNEDG